MRRISLVFTFAVVVLLALMTIDRRTHAAAQDGTPDAAAMTTHPLVGAWIVVTPGESPSVTAFGADGTMTDAESEGGTGVGAWRPTGERTAAFTLVIELAFPGFNAAGIIRGTAEVAADGQSASIAYSVTVTSPDGTVIYTEAGGQATATRLPIEPAEAMGSPLAGYPTWTLEEEATPEATPAA